MPNNILHYPINYMFYLKLNFNSPKFIKIQYLAMKQLT